MTTLTSILEALAKDTWERLHDARELSIRFGEETITDLLLLDIRRQKPANTKVIQTPKFDEAIFGTDFEWWLGSDRVGWLRFAVQAKKLDFKYSRYSGFTHTVGGKLQIDCLDEYAHANNATPLYCLYNYSSSLEPRKHWHCCQRSFEREQLGCTITPSSEVRKTILARGTKNFDWIHRRQRTIPWRCLALCPRIRSRMSPTLMEAPIVPSDVSLSVFDDQPRVHTRLPERLIQARQTGRMLEFDDEFYEPNVGHPKRIIVLEFSSEEEGINT